VSETVSLRFPAKAEYLLLTRLALAGIARAVRIDEDVLADLKLAVTEACGNAVRHAYDHERGVVRVVFELSTEEITICVEDDGAGLPTLPVQIEWSPFKDVEAGGMGLSIIRAVTDELEIERGEGGRGTVLRMRKTLAIS
jgi:serine/threonine-protein kinase RsbW